MVGALYVLHMNQWLSESWPTSDFGKPTYNYSEYDSKDIPGITEVQIGSIVFTGLHQKR